MDVDFWPCQSDGVPVDAKEIPQKKSMLVYIDRLRTTSSQPRPEYIIRMNKGIKDAVKHGVSQDYVKKAIRKFIPDVGNVTVEEVTARIESKGSIFICIYHGETEEICQSKVVSWFP